MRVGFFGTPDIAASCLGYLLDRHEVVFVVTGEDKAVGRHLHVVPGPVKSLAVEKNIPVYQPSRLKDDSLRDALAGFNADIFVVVAYGKLIPPAIFNLPRHGTINLHPSLLPLYRGAAPVEWALISGEAETGITIQMINERLDAGDILLQRKIPLDAEITAGELYDIVFPLGNVMVGQVLDAFRDGTVNPVPQDESRATFCSKIDRETCHVDWSGTPPAIHNLVRAMNPRPVAWTTFRDKNMKILRTRPVPPNETPALAPGELLVVGKKRLFAGTGDGNIEILELQPETKKAMDATSFINGSRLVPGDRFA